MNFFIQNEAKNLNFMLEYTKFAQVEYTECTGPPNLTYDGYTSPDVSMAKWPPTCYKATHPDTSHVAILTRSQ